MRVLNRFWAFLVCLALWAANSASRATNSAPRAANRALPAAKRAPRAAKSAPRAAKVSQKPQHAEVSETLGTALALYDSRNFSKCFKKQEI